MKYIVITKVNGHTDTEYFDTVESARLYAGNSTSSIIWKEVK